MRGTQGPTATVNPITLHADRADSPPGEDSGGGSELAFSGGFCQASVVSLWRNIPGALRERDSHSLSRAEVWGEARERRGDTC